LPEPDPDARPRKGVVLAPATTGVDEPPPEPPPPPSTKKDIAPPAPIAIEGKWPIREYAIDITAPEGAWLLSYHDTFGLALAFGEQSKFGPHSTIELRTNCEGSCDPGAFEAKIQNEKATAAFALVQAPKVEWIQRPTKLRDGAWWMHVRGLDDSGATTIDNVDVAFMAPQSDRGWLECVLRLQGPELARVDALRKWCEDLRWTYTEGATERADARFAGRYRIENVSITTPTIAGFHLSEYRPVEGILRLQGEASVFDNLAIQSSCQGTCSAELLKANLEAHVAERIAAVDDDGPRYTVEVPLQSPSPGVYRLRLRSSFGDEPALDIDVTRIRPGDDHMTACSVRLHGDSIARADELEAVCTKALASLR
jgi:hypothetical protein